jgi:hypothetical protein
VGSVLTATNVNGDATWQPSGAYTGTCVYSQTGATTTLGNGTYVNYSGGTITITTPASGFVVVEANVQLILSHTTGTRDYIELAIGTTNIDGGDNYNNLVWDIPAAYPTSALEVKTFTVRKTFSVAAGTYTYYLNGEVFIGWNASDVFNYAAMVATFHP